MTCGDPRELAEHIDIVQPALDQDNIALQLKTQHVRLCCLRTTQARSFSRHLLARMLNIFVQNTLETALRIAVEQHAHRRPTNLTHEAENKPQIKKPTDKDSMESQRHVKYILNVTCLPRKENWMLACKCPNFSYFAPPLLENSLFVM
jgi:hypothetical protein